MYQSDNSKNSFVVDLDKGLSMSPCINQTIGKKISTADQQKNDVWQEK
jgi:hypothetical protein